MKIDKIIFPCSETFSGFWNIQAKVWKTKLGIHPVCLLYGDKKKCGLSEEYGDVIEIEFLPNLPKILQVQFSRFWFPSLESETTSLIGDIDLIPLQSEYFTSGLEAIPDNAYCHLNYSIIGREMGLNPGSYFSNGTLMMKNGGYDLPGHYHCAKGKVFKELFFKDFSTYESFLSYIIELKKYEDIRSNDPPESRAIRENHWMAEEHYTSDMLWEHFSPRKFDGFFVKEYRAQFQRLEAKYQHAYNKTWYPDVWDGINFIHNGDKRCPNRLKEKALVEIHCPLPYEKYESAMIRLLTEAEMY
jgi:hypothetical protein